jgi:DNA polymerase-3 subunit gamma/tau
VAAPALVTAPAPKADPQSIDAVIELIDRENARILYANVSNYVRLVAFESGRIEFSQPPAAPGDLAQELTRFLNEHTDRRWVVSVTQAEGAPTINQQAVSAVQVRHDKAAENPLVKAVMEAFPGAEIETVRDVSATDTEPSPEGDPNP